MPGTDVDAVDALPHAQRSAVAAWLKAGKAVTTRRARLADIAAVALLSVCAVRVGGLVALTVSSVAADAGHTVILFRRKGGKTDRLPVPPLLQPLLAPGTSTYADPDKQLIGFLLAQVGDVHPGFGAADPRLLEHARPGHRRLAPSPRPGTPAGIHGTQRSASGAANRRRCRAGLGLALSA